MPVDVYHHSHWDQDKGRNITIPRFSTLTRIKKINGEAVQGTKKQIDESLVDAEGNAIIQVGSEDWKHLTELAAMAGQRAMISGNKSRKHLDRLTKDRLINSRAVNTSDTEHEITDLGRLALAQLS